MTSKTFVVCASVLLVQTFLGPNFASAIPISLSSNGLGLTNAGSVGLSSGNTIASYGSGLAGLTGVGTSLGSSLAGVGSSISSGLAGVGTSVGNGLSTAGSSYANGLAGFGSSFGSILNAGSGTSSVGSGLVGVKTGNVANVVATTPLTVTSISPIGPSGLAVASENVLDGIVLVNGQLPFLGTVGFEGPLPTAGSGVATCGCGDGTVGIISEGLGNLNRGQVGLAGRGRY